MHEKDESLMGQDRGCRPGDRISPIPGNECVLLCLLLCGVLHYRPRTKPLEAYCHSCDQCEILRHPSSPFSCIKSAPSGRHFRSNEEVRQPAKNFLRSLGTDSYQDGLLKLISRYDKCINVGGEYVEK
ncbi:hypothetical protein AVEN_227851-1 [Araneus ventricosus]|uniref:Uncharacterized protein n=1 Tax=Araneus ventricosus TaxID=182803 RepID=A0A4Y2UFQ3_ARAVE|nr:hypothetical protein AVEN_227851-1 [Araneus ventricosus]